MQDLRVTAKLAEDDRTKVPKIAVRGRRAWQAVLASSLLLTSLLASPPALADASLFEPGSSLLQGYSVSGGIFAEGGAASSLAGSTTTRSRRSAWDFATTSATASFPGRLPR